MTTPAVAETWISLIRYCAGDWICAKPSQPGKSA